MQITVCPSCQTSLYITDEQLRQAQGKVKCGRCLTIFDAVAHLKSDSEQNARDLFSAEFSENQPVAVKTDEVEVPTQSQQSEDNLSFSFSLPSGSSSALSGVSVRDTMRMTTDSLYSPRERQSIFSSEEISVETK